MVDSTDLTQVLHEATDIAHRAAQKLTSVHVLLALFTVENRAQLLLKEKGIDEDNLLEAMTTQPPEQEELVRELFMRAREIAQNSGAREADCLHLLVAFTRVRCAASELMTRAGLHLINLGNTALSYCLSGSVPWRFQLGRNATTTLMPRRSHPVGTSPSRLPDSVLAVSVPRPAPAPQRAPPSRPALSPRDLIDEVNKDTPDTPEPTPMLTAPPPLAGQVQMESETPPERESTPAEKVQTKFERPPLLPTLVGNDIPLKSKSAPAVLTTEELDILELIWSEFKKNGQWPRKKQMWKQLRSLGKDLEEFAAQAQWMQVGSDRVSVRFETLLKLPEVRDTLAPLPRFLRFLAHRFVDQPNLEKEWNSRGPEVKASEFFDIWGDEAWARLAAQLLDQCSQWPIRITGTLNSEFSFQPELQILSYEHVDSLEQFWNASQPPNEGSVRHEPQGRHLTLLQMIYASIRETGCWPSLVDFTLQHRSHLGYVPNLVEELRPIFIHKKQDREYPRRLRLTSHALPYVAGETGCAIAASIVRNLMELLSETESEHEFSIEQIAAKLKLPVERVRPVAMLLENEPWGTIDPSMHQDSCWRIRVFEHALWKYRDVQTWQQYVEIRNRNSLQWTFASVGVPVSAPHLPSGISIQAKNFIDHAAVGPPTIPPKGSRPENPTSTKLAQSRPKVFIGHGHSKTWMVLRDFLRDKLQLDPLEFNSTPAAGQHTVDRLQYLLNECKLAFLVMTAEDETADGSWHARANVVHEIGLFQGRLGFDKAIILLEEGCSEFSNISGFGHIRFPPDRIEACFERIRDTLKILLPAPPGM